MAKKTFQSRLDQWYQTPLGKAMAKQEPYYLREILSKAYGKELVQCGVLPYDLPFAEFKIPYCWKITDRFSDAAHLAADLTALPWQNNQIDAFILPQVMLCHEQPFEVIDEALRLIKPMTGSLIITGLNKWSIAGMSVYFRQKERGSSPYSIKQFLKAKDASIVKCYYYSLSNVNSIQQCFTRYFPVFCGGYTLVIKKQQSAPTDPIYVRFWRWLTAKPAVNPCLPTRNKVDSI